MVYSDEMDCADLKPGPPCPDQDVRYHGYCRETHETLHPVMVKLLSFLVSQPGY
jgi:hypothetical protein